MFSEFPPFNASIMAENSLSDTRYVGADMQISTVDVQPLLYRVASLCSRLQIKWCTQVFTDPAPIVVDLITEVLRDLDPSPSSLISGHLEGDDQPVAALIQLKQVG